MQLRGHNALLIFLALPFVTPVPLPGFSTPFGLVIALLGLRMALGLGLALPQRFTERKLPSAVLPRLLLSISRAFRKLEREIGRAHV